LQRYQPEDYPSRIKEFRKRFGLTQTRLAELLGVSFASINRWENGQVKPNRLAWKQLTRAEVLGIGALSKDFSPQANSSHAVGEPKAEYLTQPDIVPVLDFSTPAEIVRVVAEGERLAYGYLFNPTFGTETSRIDPLPHQRIAVYDAMLPQPRLRFLLADDAGAGKTIMAGLYIREMLTRRLIQRVLIVPPAGLVSNWEREMHTLFSLPFRVVAGSEARSDNPFIGLDNDLLIISVDTLAGEKMFSRLQEFDVTPYDLVIFDESHKLSADRQTDFTVRKTDRYKLAEALAGVRVDDDQWQLSWSARHLLLLTATPHMGKDYPYYCLWRLLEPEQLSTFDAFGAYPADARKRHFIRRTKEEMVRFDGTPIYPKRVSDTLSYDLTQGTISEQRLYDETTAYIETYYNRARILNRSAARLAMSIFQRRLASSTYALMRSFERRIEKLEKLIADIRAGKLSLDALQSMQHNLESLQDPLDEKTADEEENPVDGGEEVEAVETQLLAGLVAVSLADLEAERIQVSHLLELAHKVYDQGQESKFERLRQILRDPEFQNEKMIVFTEHRDTLEFLVRRLEGIGYAGQVAQIHGGMSTQPDPATSLSERDDYVEFFRKPADQGGARFLVATDAAGEGINLQFCWLMINYDVPWNPARLEQRMGRIHRYKQTHDPVVILNLVAGKTREGRVLKTLLDKLERIRKELGSDKVFDVVGRLFEGISLRAYMERVFSEQDIQDIEQELEGKLTPEQVRALEAHERRLYGDGGDVKQELPRLQETLSQEAYRHLLPGYARRFVEKAAPLLDIGIDGDLDGEFSLLPLKPGALDPLWPVLEMYPPERRDHLAIFHRQGVDSSELVFLQPGEPLFDHLQAYVCSRFGPNALRGGIFVDPTASQPYLFHLVLIEVVRKADSTLPSLLQEQLLGCRLIGLRQESNGDITEVPVEGLLLLQNGDGLGSGALPLVASANDLNKQAHAYALERVTRGLAETKRQALQATLPERLDFLRRGYDYQDAELAATRSKLTEKARDGDTGDAVASQAKGELTKIKARQKTLADQREMALRTATREPELIIPGEITFLAHALVVPSSDPDDQKRRDKEVELIAMRVAIAYEEAQGATVKDVSAKEQASMAGFGEYPGFDLHSRRPDGEERAIEVKGRAGVGSVDISENEWAKACNLRERYWLYVVFDCASPHPNLVRVKDPWGKLIATARGFILEAVELIEVAEE
jgi:superfamily II DNA or RNA helicase/transcriptional regulator with XRE-family HTH domain